MRVARPLPLAVLVLLFVAAGARADLLDRVLAVVAGDVITLSDVDAALTFGIVQASKGQDATGAALTQLIDRQLMLGDVNRYSAPEADPGEVDRQIQAIRGRFRTPSDFEQALARTAMTEGRLRDMVQDTLRLQRYVDQRFAGAAQPTDEDVAAYYRDHPQEFTRDGRLLPLDAVEGEARARETARRRGALIAVWIDRLRRQTDVLNLYVPGRQ